MLFWMSFVFFFSYMVLWEVFGIFVSGVYVDVLDSRFFYAFRRVFYVLNGFFLCVFLGFALSLTRWISSPGRRLLR